MWTPEFLRKPEQLTPVKPAEVKPPPVNKPESKPGEKPKPIEPVYFDSKGMFLMNHKVLELTKHFEGLVLVAEDDGYGTPTIGYGRIVFPNGRKVRNGDRCTERDANEWLLFDLEKEGSHYVRAFLKDDIENAMSQDELAVWFDLCFNRGCGRFREFILPYLNARKRSAALVSLTECKDLHYTGSYNLGLHRRRWAERLVLEGKDWKIVDTVPKFLAFKNERKL